MTTTKRQQFKNAVRQPDEVWESFELRWPRYEYVIAEHPTGALNTIWRHRKQNFAPWMERDSQGKMQPAVLARSAQWPDGGVFVPKELMTVPKNAHAVTTEDPLPRDWYNPTQVAKKILMDVQRTNPQQPKSLLKFVNTWGHLGIGIPGGVEFHYDGVKATGDYLKLITDWLQMLEALQGQKKVDSSYEDLAFLLNGVLGEIHPAVDATKTGLNPIYKVGKLIDAIWLECWETATTGKQLRRCPECGAFFLPGRSNQMYCDHRCAIRPTVRNAKRKKKEKNLS